MNSLYCFSSAASLSGSASSAASSLRCSVTLVPRAGRSPSSSSPLSSLIEYECEPADDSHCQALSLSSADLDATVTRSATRNAE